MNDKIKKFIISPDSSLVDALKQMDKLDRKLLLVMENKNYVGLVSVGDIQRAILKNIPLTEKVKNILRKKIRVCHTDDSFEEIKAKMIDFRTEFMPVLNENNELHEIIFWEDIFEDKVEDHREKLNLPVIIMAGGKGERLKPFTNIIPKPLIPMGEKPIIELIMEKFYAIGSDEFFLTVNYKHEMLKYYIDNNMNKNFVIHFVLEDKPLGTAGSLHLLKNKINSTFFVSNCDIVINQDLREVYQYHKSSGNELTAIAAVINKSIPYGIFETGENGQLISLKEKPEYSYLANTGVYILEPGLLKEIPINKHYNITDLISKLLNENRRIGVFPVSERSWSDIGEWEKYLHNINPNS